MTGWAVGKGPRGGVNVSGVPSTDPAYRSGWGNGGLPVWRDDFVDLSKLNVRNNFTTIDKARAMTPQAQIVSGNTLRLRGDWLNPQVVGGPRGVLDFDTGYVDLRNLADTANPTPKTFSLKWGRFEWEAKPCSGTNQLGALSALWLRCDNHPGEIDVMEAYGYYPGASAMTSAFNTYIKDSFVFTFHSSTTSDVVNGKPYRKTFWRAWQNSIPKNPWNKFSIYAFERMPTYMAMFVDGVQMFRVTPTSVDPVNGVGSSVNPSGSLAWLWDDDFFGSPLHPRMNLHVSPNATYYGDADRANQSRTQNLNFDMNYLYMYAPAA